MKNSCIAINIASDITLYHSGPPLDLGPLPCFFYLALSGKDSLTLDPFNQVIQFLHGKMIRCFSMTLPGHESELPATKAIQVWADDTMKNQNPIEPFLNQFVAAVDVVSSEKFIDPTKMAIGGLSRGGFVALHAAARDERFQNILGFAPITDLRLIKEYHHLKTHPITQSLSAFSLIDALAKRKIKIHIGNHDTRVSTRACCNFILDLAEQAFQNKIRSPQISCSIHPSIGHEGHGTPPEVFKQGADWILECLEK